MPPALSNTQTDRRHAVDAADRTTLLKREEERARSDWRSLKSYFGDAGKAGDRIAAVRINGVPRRPAPDPSAAERGKSGDRLRMPWSRDGHRVWRRLAMLRGAELKAALDVVENGDWRGVEAELAKGGSNFSLAKAEEN